MVIWRNAEKSSAWSASLNLSKIEIFFFLKGCFGWAEDFSVPPHMVRFEHQWNYGWTIDLPTPGSIMKDDNNEERHG